MLHSGFRSPERTRLTNIDLARSTITSVRSLGVVDFCVCSGSRNSPILAVLAHTTGVRLHSFVDERSAAFFAIGVSKRGRAPVCVVTTSGTAVAELLPAAIEAYYSGVPLLLLTADRPARFRGTAAPQCIEQEAIFGPFAARDPHAWDRRSPLHLNVEFEEPLIDAEPAGAAEPREAAPPPPTSWVEPAAIPYERPLVLVGALAGEDRSRVRDFLRAFGAAVYAEPLSGLREDEVLAPQLVWNERMLARGDFDGVVRIGHIPVGRFWRDLEDSLAHLPVVHYDSLPFPGLTRGIVLSLDQLPTHASRPADPSFLASDREMSHRINRLIESEPDSEVALVRAISEALSPGSRIYLGNSLPVREWDLAATRRQKEFRMEASRGANGIDGQLSTFFGWCAPGAENVAIIGDLTALYDLNAPWIASSMDAGFRVIIINNEGGRIFERVPGLRKLDSSIRDGVIVNAHSLRFASWAEMWGFDYSWVQRLVPANAPAPAAREVIEVVPDPAATARFWARFDQLWG